MKVLAVLLMYAGVSVVAHVGEGDKFDEGYSLAERKGCFECHALGRMEVGPSFRAIAGHYRFDAQARDRLPLVIRGGSIGHWGDRFAMWPQPRLSDAEVRQLVDWVLSQ